jgi:hypothetical protein
MLSFTTPGVSAAGAVDPAWIGTTDPVIHHFSVSIHSSNRRREEGKLKEGGFSSRNFLFSFLLLEGPTAAEK